jgi:multiple sugar transport system substrate-binding protein
LVALGGTARRNGLWLAIGLKGVHGLMTFFTLMANLGSPCATRQDGDFADRRVAHEALALMRDLLRFCPAQVLDWNSIDLHDRMMARDDLVFCPAVYCYATYAEADQRRPLRFSDFPGPNGPAGSTIGGTGLGVSASTRHLPEALAYARFAAQSDTQRAFALHHGQPAHRDAWEDEAINRRFGGCYRDTRATMEACWIRPRYRGYLTFQARGGELIEAHLRGGVAADALLAELQRLHAAP